MKDGKIVLEVEPKAKKTNKFRFSRI